MAITIRAWISRGLSVAAIAVVFIPSMAFSQAENEVIEEIFVTGVPRGGATKLEASVSVSAVLSEDVMKLAPRSVAEVFRSIPGIRA